MAHANVASLMRTVESLLTSNSPMQSLTCDHSEDFSALHEKISSLEVVVKNFEENNVSGEMTDLEVQIKEVASDAEQTIQLRVTEGQRTLIVSGKSQQRFKIRANKPQRNQWFKSFQAHQKRMLRTIWLDVDKVFTGSEAELEDMLPKSLKGKRYLILLDDMWETEAWDAVRQCFPRELKGSAILLMTRNTKVAYEAGTKNLSLQMGFMDQDESWILFKSAALSSESLPYEFETVGKKIAEKCHGLPLTIVVVAELLKSKGEIEDWKSVAKDVKSLVTNDPDERCSRVLGLRYNHLTSDLKACLLHFGIFREDSEIPTKDFMSSWMAEGFLKLENDLEGEAEKCLQELVDRCLVLVCKKSLDGTKNRSCKVHDLIYDHKTQESEGLSLS
ncbi:hypothetical protein P3S68_008964 [Capsicum galapagoense]